MYLIFFIIKIGWIRVYTRKSLDWEKAKKVQAIVALKRVDGKDTVSILSVCLTVNETIPFLKKKYIMIIYKIYFKKFNI